MFFRFTGFELDTEARELTCGGEPVHLTPKAFDLLAYLVMNRPRAISRDELFDHVWPSTVVDTSRVHQLVREVREALRDDEHRIIRTVHTRGFAFSANASAADTSHPAAFQLIVGDTAFELHAGENLIGRDAVAGVRIESSAVSRHHARIVIDGERATIEDLGSKNGTFVDGRPLRATARLTDGVTLRFGIVGAVFRAIGASPATITADVLVAT